MIGLRKIKLQWNNLKFVWWFDLNISIGVEALNLGGSLWKYYLFRCDLMIGRNMHCAALSPSLRLSFPLAFFISSTTQETVQLGKRSNLFCSMTHCITVILGFHIMARTMPSSYFFLVTTYGERDRRRKGRSAIIYCRVDEQKWWVYYFCKWFAARPMVFIC